MFFRFLLHLSQIPSHGNDYIRYTTVQMLGHYFYVGPN